MNLSTDDARAHKYADEERNHLHRYEQSNCQIVVGKQVQSRLSITVKLGIKARRSS